MGAGLLGQLREDLLNQIKLNTLHTNPMKKYLALTVASAVALTAYSQGTIDYKSPTGVFITNSLTSARVVAGTTFRVSLYYIPDQATAPTTADFTQRGVSLQASGIITPAPGIWNAGTRSTPGPGGETAWFQVRAWETAFGSTYEEAVANTQAIGGRLALVGTSNIIRVQGGNPVATPVDPAKPLTGISSFIVAPVPEPTVIGLGILGIGALLLLRRRN